MGQAVSPNKTNNTASGSADRSAILRAHPAFRDAEPAALEQLCRHAKRVSFKRGARVFLKGDAGTALFAVMSGTVRMSSSSAEGRNALLNLIGPGEIFGEIAVLDGLARTTDAIANTDCEILTIDRRDFLPFLRSQPDIAIRFIEQLCARLRWTSEQVELLVLQDIPSRLAATVVRLADRQRKDAAPVTIDISQQRVAEMVGISRESANKLLAVWVDKKWVRVEHGALVLLDLDSLRTLAGEL